MSPQKPQARSQVTLERILGAAREQFANKGFNGARVDQIARQAGVNKASLYYHCGDKTALYEQVLGGILDGLYQQINERVKQATTHPERLKAFILSFSNYLQGSPHLAPILSRAIADSGGDLPEPVVQQFLQVFGVLFIIIEEGQADGRFRQVSPMVVYNLIIGGLIYHQAGERLQARISALGGTVFERKLDAPFDVAAGSVAEIVLNSLEK